MISSRWGHVLAIVASGFSNIVVTFHEGVTVVSPLGRFRRRSSVGLRFGFLPSVLCGRVASMHWLTDETWHDNGGIIS